MHKSSPLLGNVCMFRFQKVIVILNIYLYKFSNNSLKNEHDFNMTLIHSNYFLSMYLIDADEY